MTADLGKFLLVKDEKTGQIHQIPIETAVDKNGFTIVRADAFQKMKVRFYDPGYMNTASAKSSITFIDGNNGILRYRGYAIEDLCDKCSFLDVAHLLLRGKLPSQNESIAWKNDVMQHGIVNENILQMMKSFHHNAHPMGQLVSMLAALSTFYPDANPALGDLNMYKDPKHSELQALRIIGKLPTLVASAYRNSIGLPLIYPDGSSELSYVEKFMVMLDKVFEKDYSTNALFTRTLEVLFILHADHELNCSTSAVRHLASSGVDPFTALSGGIAALYGPLHGGANEAVVRMLESIGSVDKIPSFLADVKNRKAKLMGFGHRVYKNYDPRAKIIKTYAYKIFDLVGTDPLMTVALELERQALSDDYFKKRRLFPNVDFYSGLIYKAMGFPVTMFPVLFAIPRAVGWLSHWLEGLSDPEQRIARPRQVYVGNDHRAVKPVTGETKSPRETNEIPRVVRPHSKL